MNDAAENYRQTTSVPRAVIHKKILETAESQPDASMNEIAAKVPGASVDLVEKVLDEYGDPAVEQPDADGTDDEESVSEALPSGDDADLGLRADQDSQHHPAGHVPPSNLTDKELATLRAIYENPDSTQAELAEQFGVSSATINTRVNAIDGFDWAHRQEFVTDLFEPDVSSHADRDLPSASALRDRVDELAARVSAVEHRRDEQQPQLGCVFGDPDLGHKILHACLKSDHMTEDDERQIIETVIEN